ncbi:MAG TPA: hypothetical protein VGA70_03655 [Longimicrobiales bacterium]
MTWLRSAALVAVAAAGALAAGACDEPDATVPSAREVEGYYSIPAEFSVAMNGNVAELEIYQPSDQLRRGGTLWAKVGPYIYLFSAETRDLFADHPGLAGVRVVIRAPGGTEVARALLPRTALNTITWRRALNVSGLARRDGTRRVSLLEDLVRWGEDHTEFRYNPDYVRNR